MSLFTSETKPEKNFRYSVTFLISQIYSEKVRAASSGEARELVETQLPGDIKDVTIGVRWVGAAAEGLYTVRYSLAKRYRAEVKANSHEEAQALIEKAVYARLDRWMTSLTVEKVEQMP